MQQHQHPQFLLALLGRMETMARDLAARLAQTQTESDRTIADSPKGSPGYRHVCTMEDGTTIAIRRVRQYDPSLGLQLELRRGEGSCRVPDQPPFIPWNPRDEDLGALAGEHAAAVLSALVSL